MKNKKHFLNLFCSLFLFLLSVIYCHSSQAAEQAVEPATAPVTTVAPVARVESEKAKSWKALQAQEQWVSRLKKQIDGETKQLSEMRAQVAEKFKLDPKKLDSGEYTYDEKKDAFVER